jgi:rhodanese-related sulfurtransferase
MATTPAELVANAKRRATTCSCEEAVKWIERHPTGRLIDVREPPEHAAAKIAGSVSVPRGVVEFAIGAACEDPDTPVLLFCASGGRAALAALALEEVGYFDVCAVDGPFEELARLIGVER